MQAASSGGSPTHGTYRASGGWREWDVLSGRGAAQGCACPREVNLGAAASVEQTLSCW